MVHSSTVGIRLTNIYQSLSMHMNTLRCLHHADGVRQLLGALPLEFALGAVLAGADVLGDLVPALAAVLSTGSLPTDMAYTGCDSQLSAGTRPPPLFSCLSLGRHSSYYQA